MLAAAAAVITFPADLKVLLDSRMSEALPVAASFSLLTSAATGASGEAPKDFGARGNEAKGTKDFDRPRMGPMVADAIDWTHGADRS